jgi:hypothetical protein
MVGLLVLDVGVDVGEEAGFDDWGFGFDKTGFSALRVCQVSRRNVFYVALLGGCLLDYFKKFLTLYVAKILYVRSCLCHFIFVAV